MADLFYTLLGIGVIVLPIYLVVRGIKKKNNSNKTIKENKKVKQEEPKIIK